jgi:hypothetical protein
MPKRKTPVEKPEEQFERFVETARKLEVTETEAEAAFSMIAKSKNPTKNPASSTKT